MVYLFLVLWMIFFHIVDDYYLQGWLASAKQKKYWQENAPEKMYRYDYIWALLMHSFSWSFMIMLPIAFVNCFDLSVLFLIVFVSNVIVHAVVDDLKANKRKINLWTDQIIHICQIVITAFIFLGLKSDAVEIGESLGLIADHYQNRYICSLTNWENGNI